MKSQKTVFLFIGPRGAGKSYYLNKLVERQPELQVVSRDQILTEKYGSVHISTYGGGIYFVRGIMNDQLKQKLAMEQPVKILFDCWTGFSRERKELLTEIREAGADRVIALYFVTPVEVVSEWFWMKPGVAMANRWNELKGQDYVFFSEISPRVDHKIFHQNASGIDQEGFDEVIRIDPQQKLINPL